MYISDTEKRAFLWKNAFIYYAVTGFCAVFGAVYELFSNGVMNNFMIFAFLVPLVCGALPYTVSALICRSVGTKPVRYAHHSGVASLTLYSVMRGVLEIYGTDSALLPVYLYAAGAFFLFALTSFLTELICKNEKKEKKA